MASTRDYADNTCTSVHMGSNCRFVSTEDWNQSIKSLNMYSACGRSAQLGWLEKREHPPKS